MSLTSYRQVVETQNLSRSSRGLIGQRRRVLLGNTVSSAVAGGLRYASKAPFLGALTAER